MSRINIQEKVDLEGIWNSKLESLVEKFQQEKEELMKNHRENLQKALEEARAKWQQVWFKLRYHHCLCV